MSLFGTIEPNEPVIEDITGALETLRNSITMPMLVHYLGMEREGHFVRCPKHGGGRERTPSARVYDDHIYCYGCGAYWDVIGLVREYYGLEFREAVLWSVENLSGTAVPIYKSTSRHAEYRGPASLELVSFWHSCLKPAEREWLYRRLIKDETINSLMIGWRPDWQAYSIPFWRGEPQQSEIDIVQFRLTNSEKRWGGLRGHNRPSVINANRVGKHSVVVLFGTFDALLAAQDGISAVSINGATSFMRDLDNLARLKSTITSPNVFVVPDKSETETKPAYLLASALNAQVRHFPDMEGKDYTDFRMAGNKPTQFLSEVLMTSIAITDPAHGQMVQDVLLTISNADERSVETILQCLEVLYNAPLVNHDLQVRMQFDPYTGLSHDQWEILRTQIETCMTYDQLQAWAKTGCRMSHENRGGF